MPPIVRRLGHWILDGLISIDHFVHWWLGGWGYIWFNTERPGSSETISSWVGRNAIKGVKIALIAEKVINTIFFWRPNHCRNAIGT